MPVARDVNGRQLMVGQKVAYCLAGKCQEMRTGTVAFVRNKTVEMELLPGELGEWGVRRNHAAVCIIVE